MSQDEEKTAPETSGEEEDRLLETLVLRFDSFTQQVLERLDVLLEMKTTVDKLFQASAWKKAKDAERKRQQRARELACKQTHLIELPKDIWRRKDSLTPKYLLWAHIGIQYGVVSGPCTFLEWLASDWCHNTFTKKPITRVSNRPNYWDRGIRHECTWTDMFGRETGINPKTFDEPIFWGFASHVMQVLQRLEQMPDWPNVQRNFREMMQLCASSFAGWTDSGLLQKGNHAEFEHCAKGIGEIVVYRDMATRAMQAFRRGIQKGIVEDPELVRMGRARATEHQRLLLMEKNKLLFMHNLRKGQLTADEKAQVEALHIWGYRPDFKKEGFGVKPTIKNV